MCFLFFSVSSYSLACTPLSHELSSPLGYSLPQGHCDFRRFGKSAYGQEILKKSAEFLHSCEFKKKSELQFLGGLYLIASNEAKQT